jgi:hypothetical protein
MAHSWGGWALADIESESAAKARPEALSTQNQLVSKAHRFMAIDLLAGPGIIGTPGSYCDKSGVQQLALATTSG